MLSDWLVFALGLIGFQFVNWLGQIVFLIYNYNYNYMYVYMCIYVKLQLLNSFGPMYTRSEIITLH